MTDRASSRNSPLARSSSHISSTSRATESPSASARPRNRRLAAAADSQETDSIFGGGLLSAFSASSSRTGSPLPSLGGTSRSAGVSPSRSNAATGDIGQFLSDSWTQSWSSVQGLTSSLFSGTPTPGGKQTLKTGPRGRRLSTGNGRKANASWGPAPPSSKPGLNDVGAGSLEQRQAAFKAARTASVLESHDGVNGGLDVSGKHKRRNSDEVVAERRDDDYLVYVHHVQPNDTFVGIILRYKCREDVFRKANGLWSRDSIQTRKWVTIPVAACEARSRPCEAPSWHNDHNVDLLAPTPNAKDDASKGKGKAPHDDYFSSVNGSAEEQAEDDEKPWTHVRWVKIDSIEEPVEIGRVARGAMGYFPPRRRKSIRTISSLSTPRQSFDLPNPGSAEGPSPRRPSSLSSRPQLSGTPTSNRSRMGSDPMDNRPAWMKRPGGVGSMGRSVKAPGPDRDVFNTWTQKHIPGLNIEGPSMSIMGTETARFGFQNDSSLAENSYEDGRDASNLNRLQGGSTGGLDKAAAAVENWLQGALSKVPGTPLGRSRAGGNDGAGDLIELTDTGSDDGRLADITNNSFPKLSLASSGRQASSTSVRGRTGAQKGGKDD